MSELHVRLGDRSLEELVECLRVAESRPEVVVIEDGDGYPIAGLVTPLSLMALGYCLPSDIEASGEAEGVANEITNEEIDEMVADIYAERELQARVSQRFAIALAKRAAEKRKQRATSAS